MELKKFKLQEHFDMLERKSLRVQRDIEIQQKYLDERRENLEKE